MAFKLQLTQSWQHPYRAKPYPVGQIVICDSELASELIRTKKAVRYSGEYPPKEKVKTDFFKPLNK